MKIIRRAAPFLLFALTLAAVQFRGTEALALSSYFSSKGCTGCHGAPVVASCNGCHKHGPASLKGATNKASYAPGETVSVTITGGNKTGWFRAVLYNQSTVEVARSTGSASGMGGSATYPAVLTAPAPAAAGTYTWKVAWYGNKYDSAALGASWVPDANNPNHGEVRVSTNSFTVVAAAPSDKTAPVVSAFTLPATAASLSVPVSSLTATDNVKVTGYMITTSATAPAAGAAGWSATAPANAKAAAAGSVKFYAWAKDAAGNVSAAKSATVGITVAASTAPTLTLSTLPNGAYTRKATLNVSGKASDPDGIKSVTVNGVAVTVAVDGSFSTAVPLVIGANIIKVVATDNSNISKTVKRTINYDLTAPLLSAVMPADGSATAKSFATVTGTISETSTVTVTVNGGSPQSAAINGTSFSATVNLDPGTNTLYITAKDLAGNVSHAKRTIVSDSILPSLAVTNPKTDITISSATMLLKGTVSDNIGKVKIKITMEGVTYTPAVVNGAFQQQLTCTVAKQYAITVVATDEAGNRSKILRNVIYKPVAASHPFGWTNPRSSHPDYVDSNGVDNCISCHSIDLASKGKPMSCYNCHGKEWETPSTGGTAASHPFGWTNPRSSHPNYVDSNGTAGCVSCHSIDPASQGKPMSCYNCHGKKW